MSSNYFLMKFDLKGPVANLQAINRTIFFLLRRHTCISVVNTTLVGLVIILHIVDKSHGFRSLRPVDDKINKNGHWTDDEIKKIKMMMLCVIEGQRMFETWMHFWRPRLCAIVISITII